MAGNRLEHLVGALMVAVLFAGHWHFAADNRSDRGQDVYPLDRWTVQVEYCGPPHFKVECPLTPD
jgi:hypothetical protein